jgi:hypothetical protein
LKDYVFVFLAHKRKGYSFASFIFSLFFFWQKNIILFFC